MVETNSDKLTYDSMLQIKGISCLFIILSHAIDTRYSINIRWLVSGYLWVGVFFFFSGYGFLFSVDSKKDYINTFWRKKIPSLYIPFVMAETIYMLIAGGFNERNPLLIIVSILGIMLKNKTLWYIVEMMVIWELCIIVLKFTKTINGLFIGIITIFYVMWLTLSVVIDIGTWWYISTSSFVLGIGYKYWSQMIKKMFENRFLHIGGILVTMTLFVFQYAISVNPDIVGRGIANYAIVAMQMIVIPCFTVLLVMNLSELLFQRKIFLLCKVGGGIAGSILVSYDSNLYSE